MASVVQAPRLPAPQGEAFVEQRIKEARSRVRLLDMFSAGLTLFAGSMLVLVAWLLVDRSVETPPGTGWAALAGWAVLAAGYLYWALFRPSRRHINPYYAARQVERTIPDAKNSVINYVDLQDDARVPDSIRKAVATRAARDLKQVDVNRAIERKTIIWLTFAAAIAFAGALVAAFLPPTRTEIRLDEPKGGDVTVFSGQDVHFAAHLGGRIPPAGEADAARVRIWYNPDDPDNFEDRPLGQAPEDRRTWNLTIPAKQMRSGFEYQVRAGNAETKRFTVTYKIIPAFFGYDVHYEYPDYTKRAPETKTDPNLVANFGTKVTLTAHTNRDVAGGYIQIDGQAKTYDGFLVKDKPQSIRFHVPLERDGTYRIWFTTTEGDKNSDPPRFRMTLLDPKPAFHRFDVHYDYPAYLRFKPVTVRGVPDPEIEALRGTQVTLTAQATRPIKDAKLLIDGAAQPLAGERVKGSPATVVFKLPALDKQTGATVSFAPTTPEDPAPPKRIPIRVLTDAKPEVDITKTIPAAGLPEGDLPPGGLEELIKQGKADAIQVPLNGALSVDGLATDDHGIDKVTMRIELVEPAAQRQLLAPRPYRGGKSFKRDSDQSFPTRIEYKDQLELSKLTTEAGKPLQVVAGMGFDVWLEAVDNCAVPPGPNVGVSKRVRFYVNPPPKDEQRQKEMQNRDEKRQEEQKQHEQQQDRQNQKEDRDPKQPEPPQQGANKDEADKKDQPDKKDDGQGGKPEDNKDQKKDNSKEPEGKGEPGKGTEKKDAPAEPSKDGTGEKKDPSKKAEPGQSEKKDTAEKQDGDGQPPDPKKDEEARRDAQKVEQALKKQHEQNRGQDKPREAPQNQEGPEQAPMPKEAGKGNHEPMPQPKVQQPKDDQGGAGAKKDGAPKQPDKDKQKEGGTEGGKNDAAQPKLEPKKGEGKAGQEKSPGDKQDKKGKEGATDPKQKDAGKDQGGSQEKRKDGDAEPKEPKADKGAGGKDKPEKKDDTGGNNTATKDPKSAKPPDANQKSKGEPGKSEEPGQVKPQGDNPMGQSDEPQSGKAKPGPTADTPGKPEQGASKPEKTEGKKVDTPPADKGGDKPDPDLPPKEGQGGDKEKLDPETIKKIVKDLKDGNQKKRDNAQEKLNNLAADKQAREEARKKLEEALKNATDQEKKDLADALKQLGDAAKKTDDAQAKKDAKDDGTGQPKERGPAEAAKKDNDPKDGSAARDPQLKTDPKLPRKEKEGDGSKKETDVTRGTPKKDAKESEGTNPKLDKGKGPNDPKEGPKNGPGDAGQREAKDSKGKEGKDTGDGKAKGKEFDPKSDTGAETQVGGARKGEAKGAEYGTPEAADARHRLKAGELQLENFKKNKDQIREAMKWDDKQLQEFLRSQEEALKRQAAEVARQEKAERQNLSQGAKSPLDRAEKTVMPKLVKDGDALQGGKYKPPPGFDESYKQFTEELNSVPPK